MQRLFNYTILLAMVTAFSGCGKSDGPYLRTPGRLQKGGQSFVAQEGEFIQVTFVPIMPDNSPALDYYYADVDQVSGSFVPAGKNRKGMPPGKYRVAVELMKKKKDLLGGKFDAAQSPFVFDFDASTKEIVIDIEKPPAA
ncbi:MAG TPA: hypothetical protein VKU82_09060 [Planctomycetaceae bacterium]|nr:hypothetical protein [Planctomycetaceae bacterium]